MSDSSPRRRWPVWLVPAALVVAALLIRVYYTTYDRVVWGDEPFYLWIGESLWSGNGYNFFGYSGAHFPPLYPALAGGLALLTGSLQWASNLIYIATGALLVLPLYYLVRATVNATAAWMTGLVVALYPALTSGVLAWGTMTEPLYLLWVGLAVYLLFLALDRKPGRWREYFLLGAALGLAYLTRTEALVLVVAMFGLLLIGRLVRRDRFVGLIVRLAASLAVFLLVASPYLVYIRQETGHWNLTGAAGMAFVSMTGLAEKDPSAFDRSTWELDPASGEVYIFAPSSETEPLLPALLGDPLALLRRLRAGLLRRASPILQHQNDALAAGGRGSAGIAGAAVATAPAARRAGIAGIAGRAGRLRALLRPGTLPGRRPDPGDGVDRHRRMGAGRLAGGDVDRTASAANIGPAVETTVGCARGGDVRAAGRAGTAGLAADATHPLLPTRPPGRGRRTAGAGRHGQHDSDESQPRHRVPRRDALGADALRDLA